jgi:hypothetical protein
VVHHAGTHHVEVDVDETAPEVLAALHRRRVVAILPKGPVAMLAIVVRLCGPTGQQLQAAGDLTAPLVAHQQMHVIGGDDVVEHAEPVALARRVQPADPGAPIAREAQQELLAMAAVREVPDVVRQMMAMGARHGLSSLRAVLWARNRRAKPAGDPDPL